MNPPPTLEKLDQFARWGWIRTQWGQTEHFRLTKGQQNRFDEAKQLGYLKHAEGQTDRALAELWGTYCETRVIPDATIRTRGKRCKIVIDLIFIPDFRLSHYEAEVLRAIWCSYARPDTKRMEGMFGTYINCQVPLDLVEGMIRRFLISIEQFQRSPRVVSRWGSDEPQDTAWRALLHSTIPPCKCRPGKRPCMYCLMSDDPERRNGYYAVA